MITRTPITFNAIVDRSLFKFSVPPYGKVNEGAVPPHAGT